MPVLPRRRLRAKTPLRAEKCTRQARRRRALACFNELAAELGLGTEPLRVKERRASVVTRRIRLLEPRCQEGELPQRLRAATELWAQNGGKLLQGVLPPPATVCRTEPDRKPPVLPRRVWKDTSPRRW